MNIIEIEGIGPAFQAKLRAVHVQTTDDLLRVGRTAAERTRLSESTGISKSTLLEWINHADLMRIKGVGSEYADLLEEAGVDTVAELARRNPAHLHVALEECNTEKKAVRRTPSAEAVATWVTEAQTLDRAIEY